MAGMSFWLLLHCFVHPPVFVASVSVVPGASTTASLLKQAQAARTLQPEHVHPHLHAPGGPRHNRHHEQATDASCPQVQPAGSPGPFRTSEPSVVSTPPAQVEEVVHGLVRDARAVDMRGSSSCLEASTPQTPTRRRVVSFPEDAKVLTTVITIEKPGGTEERKGARAAPKYRGRNVGRHTRLSSCSSGSGVDESSSSTSSASSSDSESEDINSSAADSDEIEKKGNETNPKTRGGRFASKRKGPRSAPPPGGNKGMVQRRPPSYKDVQAALGTIANFLRNQQPAAEQSIEIAANLDETLSLVQSSLRREGGSSCVVEEDACEGAAPPGASDSSMISSVDAGAFASEEHREERAGIEQASSALGSDFAAAGSGGRRAAAPSVSVMEPEAPYVVQLSNLCTFEATLEAAPGGGTTKKQRAARRRKNEKPKKQHLLQKQQPPLPRKADPAPPVKQLAEEPDPEAESFSCSPVEASVSGVVRAASNEKLECASWSCFASSAIIGIADRSRKALLGRCKDRAMLHSVSANVIETLADRFSRALNLRGRDSEPVLHVHSGDQVQDMSSKASGRGPASEENEKQQNNVKIRKEDGGALQIVSCLDDEGDQGAEHEGVFSRLLHEETPDNFPGCPDVDAFAEVFQHLRNMTPRMLAVRKGIAHGLRANFDRAQTSAEQVACGPYVDLMDYLMDFVLRNFRIVPSSSHVALREQMEMLCGVGGLGLSLLGHVLWESFAPKIIGVLRAMDEDLTAMEQEIREMEMETEENVRKDGIASCWKYCFASAGEQMPETDGPDAIAAPRCLHSHMKSKVYLATSVDRRASCAQSQVADDVERTKIAQQQIATAMKMEEEDAAAPGGKTSAIISTECAQRARTPVSTKNSGSPAPPASSSSVVEPEPSFVMGSVEIPVQEFGGTSLSVGKTVLFIDRTDGISKLLRYKVSCFSLAIAPPGTTQEEQAAKKKKKTGPPFFGVSVLGSNLSRFKAPPTTSVPGAVPVIVNAYPAPKQHKERNNQQQRRTRKQMIEKGKQQQMVRLEPITKDEFDELSAAERALEEAATTAHHERVLHLCNKYKWRNLLLCLLYWAQSVQLGYELAQCQRYASWEMPATCSDYDPLDCANTGFGCHDLFTEDDGMGHQLDDFAPFSMDHEDFGPSSNTGDRGLADDSK